MADSKLAHVSFKCGKRLVDVDGQNSLESLKRNFNVKFADLVGPNEKIRFQVFVKSAEDFIDVETEEDIKKGDAEILKIKAFACHKEEEIEHKLLGYLHLCCEDHCATDHELCGCDWKRCSIPWFVINSSTNFLSHPIETAPNVRYEVWSAVSRQAGSLLKKQGCLLKADGTSGDKSCEIQALSATLSSIQYNFVFGESSRLFAITAPLNLDKTLQVQVKTNDDSQKFGAKYCFIYTVLESVKYPGYYVNVDHSGEVKLKKMISVNYPDPGALLLFHKVKSSTSTECELEDAK